MKNIKIILIALFTSTIIMSCENDFVVENDEYVNKIVVNSVFSNSGILSAEITKTFSPYETVKVVELSSARVSLFKDGTFVEDLTYRKTPQDTLGKFVSTTIPEQGKSYSIKVTDSKLGTATSESYVPAPFGVSNLSAIWLKWGEYNTTSMRYNFKFTLHDSETTDYYYLTIAFPVMKKNEDTGQWYFYAYQYCEIQTGDLPLHQLYLRNGFLFEDKAFNGINHVVSGTATTYRNPFGDFDYEWPTDTNKIKVDSLHLHITVRKLTKELYTFYSSHATVLKNENNIYSEPTPIYSNIENGVGVFGGEFVIESVVETK